MESLANNVTGLLIIDPYDDFVSEGGKLWSYAKNVAETLNAGNMRRVLKAPQSAKLRLFFAPHHLYREGDYSRWNRLGVSETRKQ